MVQTIPNFSQFRREARLLEGYALRMAYDQAVSIANFYQRNGDEDEFLRWEILASKLGEEALEIDWRKPKREV